jgi:1,4-alpha-glucan branching enzyme
VASSQQPGMGAIPYAGGVTFRVWTPFASKVSVTGTFNNWQPEAIQLARDGNSAYWSCDVLGANVGDQYKFVLRNASIPDRFWKNDPYARAVTNSVGNSIIAETGRPRGDLGYATPNWNEMVIYELHVGSFRFDPGSGNGRATLIR